MTCKLTDLEKFIDGMKDKGKKEIRLDDLEREIAAEFNIGKPIPIKERVFMLVRMGIIKETGIVGIFRLVGSSWRANEKLGFDIEEPEIPAQSETSVPKKKKDPETDPDEEKAIDNLLGVDV